MFTDREMANEAKQMALIADLLLQEINDRSYTKRVTWDSRAIAQMTCEIYCKLSEP
jgi:hypothetical protein